MKEENIETKVNLYNVLKGMLNMGSLQVTFTKKDGTERVMKCTTKLSNIPKDKQPIGESTITDNEEVIRAYDIESNGWRSFRVKTVKTFEFV